jgi:uncharacterized protein (TIGR03435 family)
MLQQIARKLNFNRRLSLFVAGWIAVAALALGQGTAARSGRGVQISDAAAKVPAFEVVSVRLNKSGKGFGLTYTSDGFTTTNMPLQSVIVNAYNLRDQQLIVGGQLIPGGPSWINSDRYDIQAKMSDSDIAQLQKLSVDQQLAQKRFMLQSMLADRFKLKVHRETKRSPCYTLVIGKNGSKMKEATSIDPALPDGKFIARPGVVTAQGASLARLVFVLTGPLHCPVQDKTGLVGKYDFELQYSPDQGSSPDDSGPSLFTALQEQLGLRLIPTSVPVEGIVIDHVEQPSRN